MSMKLSVLGPERRYISVTDIEERSEDAPGMRFAGLAAVFGKRSYIGQKPHGFWEKVERGAFAKAIEEGDVRMLHNHDPNLVLARSTITEGPGSLVLSESTQGLRTTAEFVDTSYARDVDALLRARAVSQMSFSFTPLQEDWGKAKTGEDERTLREVSLYDVSTVTFPAYTETAAAMRAVGLDGLLRHADLNEEDRLRFFSAIRTGIVSPDLAPALRAASEALVELAQRCEPSQLTRTDADAASDGDMARRLRYRALTAMSAEWRRGIPEWLERITT